MDDILLKEVLEFELYFEMAQYLHCNMDDLDRVKADDPGKYKSIAKYVLENVVTAGTFGVEFVPRPTSRLTDAFALW